LAKRLLRATAKSCIRAFAKRWVCPWKALAPRAAEASQRMTSPLLPPSFLFRFSAPCRYKAPLWSDKGGQLDESYRLLSVAELDGRSTFAEFRVAWSEQGFAFAVRVEGKTQAPWCRESRPDDSDGVRLWIDTRDTHNIHRASRFCHQFAFLPAGAGRALDE